MAGKFGIEPIYDSCCNYSFQNSFSPTENYFPVVNLLNIN